MDATGVPCRVPFYFTKGFENPKGAFTILLKKFYLPIGILIVALCAVGLFLLRSDVPEEPIVIHKPTITETPLKVTAAEETAQEKFDREMREKMALKEQEIAKYKEKTAKYNDETAKYKEKTAKYKEKIAKYNDKTAKYNDKTAAIRAEFEALKAKDAERTEYLSRITEKGKEFVAQFPDMLEMTPEKYLALSETEQEKFLLRCVEYDLLIENIQEIINSMPQWILDECDDSQPGAIDEFLNLPSLTELYGSL